MEEFFVERLIRVFAPHGEEDVAADELVHDFALGRESLENDLFIIAQLDHHVFRLPIDVPRLLA